MSVVDVSVINIKALRGDPRLYRIVRLKNGLKAILVENNKLSTASVSLQIEAGFHHEPKEYPGLAHFLEHMVFMGSQKYPDEDHFATFVQSHLGSQNGVTTEETTYFPWDIAKVNLNEGLDIFSQFFICPLLKKDAMAREVNAVHNEYTGKLQSDAYRFLHVQKGLLNKEHPASRFNHGNNITLPLAKEDELLSALKLFHQQHYTADNMTLMICSSHTLDELEAMVRTHFSAILSSDPNSYPSTDTSSYPSSDPNSGYSKQKLIKPLRFTEQSLQHKVMLESLEGSNRLCLSFILNEKRTPELMHAVGHIKNLLTTSIPGGLFQTLKEKGLILDRTPNGKVFEMQYDFVDDVQVDMAIFFPLAECNDQNIDEITKITFEYIHFLMQEGINADLFYEYQEYNERALQFESESLAIDLLYNLNHYPLDRFFIGHTNVQGTPFPREKVMQVLEGMKREHLNQYVFTNTKLSDSRLSKDEKIAKETIVPKGVLKLEPWTNTSYITLPINDAIKPNSSKLYSAKHDSSKQDSSKLDASNLESSKQNSSFTKNDKTVVTKKFTKFATPKKNPYIPKQFELVNLDVNAKLPRAIHLSERSRLWLSHDHHFKKPLLQTECCLISGLIDDSILHKACFTLFYPCIVSAIDVACSDHFASASLSVNITSNARGLILSVSGYSDKQYQLIEDIFSLLVNFKLTGEEDLLLIKRQVFEFCDNSNIVKSSERANYFLNQLLSFSSLELASLRKAVQSVDYKTLNEYIQSFLSAALLEIYSHGNTTADALKALGEKIVNLLPSKQNQEKVFPKIFPKVPVVNLPMGKPFVFSFDSHHPDCSVLHYIQAPDVSDETARLMEILSQFMNSRFYDELRTEEQLAYHLECGLSEIDGFCGIAFYIKTPNHVAKQLGIPLADLGQYLMSRIEQFLVDFETFFEKYSVIEFEALKSSIAELRLEGLINPSSPSAYASRMNNRFTYNRYFFAGLFNPLDPYKHFTLDMLKKLYQSMISVSTRKCLTIKTSDKSDISDKSDKSDISSMSDVDGICDTKDMTDKCTSPNVPKALTFSSEILKRTSYTVISDIDSFKATSTLYPDPFLEGEEYITLLQSLFVLDVFREPQPVCKNVLSASEPEFNEPRILADEVLSFCFPNRI